MKADTEQGTKTAIMEEKTGKTPEEEKRGRGRPFGPSQTSLADLVTFKDLKDAIVEVKAIIHDKDSSHALKLNAAKFLLAVKSDGINQTIRRKQINSKQNTTSNGKPEKPTHAISINYANNTRGEDSGENL